MKEARFILFLLAGILLGLWILQQARHFPVPVAGSPATGGDTPVPVTGPLSAVDFRNFRYQPSCVGRSADDPQVVVAKDGRFERDQEDDRVVFAVLSVVHGDLTGDGTDEAAVLTSCNTGGTGDFSEAYIFGMQDGQPVELARTDTGDRAYGGIKSVKIEDGQLVLERYATVEGGPSCCPRYVDTLHFRLQGRTLVQVGEASRRDVPPPS